VKKKLEIYMKSFIVMDIAEIWREILNVVCWEVEVSATGWSLVRRSPTDCGVSEYDLEAPIMKGLGPPGAVASWKKKSPIGCDTMEIGTSVGLLCGNFCLLGVEFCLFYPEYEANRFLRNVSKYQQNYKTSHHTTRSCCEYWLINVYYIPNKCTNTNLN
jgi:hypothetical protein